MDLLYLIFIVFIVALTILQDEDVRRALYLKWKYSWSLFPGSVRMGIGNIYKWFPVIWRDRDWDYRYMIELLIIKLQRMAEYHESRKYYEGWENNVKWMNTTRELLKHMVNETYEMEPYDYMETKFEFVAAEDNPEYSTLNTDIISEHLDDYLEKYPREVEKAKQTLNRTNSNVDFSIPEGKRRLAAMTGMYVQQKSDKLAFKLLSRYVKGWWD